MEAFIRSHTVQEDVVLPSTTPGKLIFSFSGIKAAVKRQIGTIQPDDTVRKHAIAAAFQKAAVGQLEEKVALALKKDGTGTYTSLVVSGGVASNLYLRER